MGEPPISPPPPQPVYFVIIAHRLHTVITCSKVLILRPMTPELVDEGISSVLENDIPWLLLNSDSVIVHVCMHVVVAFHDTLTSHTILTSYIIQTITQCGTDTNTLLGQVCMVVNIKVCNFAFA